MERQMKRYGRLVWAEVQLDLSLATKVHATAMPIDSIRTAELIADLGGVASLADLRTKLLVRYAPSVVHGMFQPLRITPIEDAKERSTPWEQPFFKPAPPFAPIDPK